MSAKRVAAESIRRLAQQYQDMVAAAEALEQVGAIEQCLLETRKAVQAEELKLNDARESVKSAGDERDNIVNLSKKIGQEAEEKANSLILTANEQAASIKDKARYEADMILAVARKRADGLTDDLAKTLAVKRDELAAIEASIAQAKATADEMNTVAVAAEARLAKVQAQIKKLADV